MENKYLSAYFNRERTVVVMTVRTIKHEELKGGYSMGRKIIVDACEVFGEFEIMVMYDGGEEIESHIAEDEAEAVKIFDEMLLKYAEPLQKALYNKLVEGGKYTLVYLNDFGFPVAQKITFHSMKCTAYAQYSDVIEMVFTPYRKRSQYKKYFYNCSLMIFEGWQDLKEEDTKEVLKDDGNIRTTKSKYGCFDGRYIEDLEAVFKNAVVSYKKYEVGTNGKVYA